jgi:C1A family cysteine protease
MFIIICIVLIKLVAHVNADYTFIHPITNIEYNIKEYTSTIDDWTNWKTQYSVNIDAHTKEDLSRYEIFQANIKKINQHNSNTTSYVKKPNQYTYYTEAEFKTNFLTLKREKQTFKDKFAPSNHFETQTTLPDSINWFEKSGTPQIQDQGSCGSCYVFSTLTILEYLYWIQYSIAPFLSRQQLVDCINPGKTGCNGGNGDEVVDYIKQNSICYAKNYEYTGVYGTCGASNPSVCAPADVIKPNTINIINPTTTNVKLAIAQAPILVYLDASGIQDYAFGLYDGSGCSNTINHAVVFVGYGTSEFVNKIGQQSYYIVQNSWGTLWGEDGLMYISQSNICGIYEYSNLHALSLNFNNETLPINIYTNTKVEIDTLMIFIIIVGSLFLLTIIYFIWSVVNYVRAKKAVVQTKPHVQMTTVAVKPITN